MCPVDADGGITPELPGRPVRARAVPQRECARIRVELTEREARSLVRAATLVADLLRPDLFRQGQDPVQSPLVTAYQVLVAACERHGVDLGLSVPIDRWTGSSVRNPR